MPPKKCSADKILNPKTGRCVSKSGKIGKQLVTQSPTRASSKVKPPLPPEYEKVLTLFSLHDWKNNGTPIMVNDWICFKIPQNTFIYRGEDKSNQSRSFKFYADFETACHYAFSGDFGTVMGSSRVNEYRCNRDLIFLDFDRIENFRRLEHLYPNLLDYLKLGFGYSSTTLTIERNSTGMDEEIVKLLLPVFKHEKVDGYISMELPGLHPEICIYQPNTKLEKTRKEFRMNDFDTLSETVNGLLTGNEISIKSLYVINNGGKLVPIKIIYNGEDYEPDPCDPSDAYFFTDSPYLRGFTSKLYIHLHQAMSIREQDPTMMLFDSTRREQLSKILYYLSKLDDDELSKFTNEQLSIPAIVHVHSVPNVKTTITFKLKSVLATWDAVLSGLQSSPAFCTLFSQSIIDASVEQGWKAVYWECSSVSAPGDDEFSMSLYPAPELVDVKEDFKPFKSYFTNSPVVSFKNRSRDVQLVVPVPQLGIRGGGHLLSYLHSIHDHHVWWNFVANEIRRVLRESPPGHRFWVSTHGLGVHWLHVRIEDNPKYYHEI